ncbi:unnamed protein product, partial [Iphiclides podalirius]
MKKILIFLALIVVVCYAASSEAEGDALPEDGDVPLDKMHDPFYNRCLSRLSLDPRMRIYLRNPLFIRYLRHRCPF